MDEGELMFPDPAVSGAASGASFGPLEVIALIGGIVSALGAVLIFAVVLVAVVIGLVVRAFRGRPGPERRL
jgi:hypothetical protein